MRKGNSGHEVGGGLDTGRELWPDSATPPIGRLGVGATTKTTTTTTKQPTIPSTSSCLACCVMVRHLICPDSFLLLQHGGLQDCILMTVAVATPMPHGSCDLACWLQVAVWLPATSCIGAVRCGAVLESFVSVTLDIALLHVASGRRDATAPPTGTTMSE
jgi:hypothetical protein